MNKEPEMGLEIDRRVTDEIIQEFLEKFRDFLLRKELPGTKYSM